MQLYEYIQFFEVETKKKISATTTHFPHHMATLLPPFSAILVKCDWIWQNLASTHRPTLVDIAISSNNCIIASWCIMLKRWKLQQVLVYFLAIIEWVNNRKFKLFLSSFFCDGNDITGGSWWVGVLWCAILSTAAILKILQYRVCYNIALLPNL